MFRRNHQSCLQLVSLMQAVMHIYEPRACLICQLYIYKVSSFLETEPGFMILIVNVLLGCSSCFKKKRTSLKEVQT